MRKLMFSIMIFGLILGCKDEEQPKPNAFLALNYPEAKYAPIALNCPYSFEKNEISNIVIAEGNNPCWINIKYPLLEAAIFVTYQPVNNNLDSLLMDAQKLPLQHTIKADFIEGDIYENIQHRAYGMFYEIDGNAASQAEFYITDSTKHFLTGSLYFNHRPNFDSIMPAAAYVKKDMRHLMESIKWQ